MVRIGVDLVEIEKLSSAITDYPRLAGRLFTPREIGYAESRRDPYQHLAARLAAKEAVFKALNSGWPYLSWQDVEVTSAGGPPTIELSGRVAEIAGRSRASLSMSHAGGYAMAQVVMVEPERPESVEWFDV